MALPGKFERYFFAFGRAARAIKNSAQNRTEPEVPAAPVQPSVPITLVRCPRCGNYAPAGQACSCGQV